MYIFTFISVSYKVNLNKKGGCYQFLLLLDSARACSITWSLSQQNYSILFARGNATEIQKTFNNAVALEIKIKILKFLSTFP